MNLDWKPEPTPDEREALEQALDRLLAERDDPRGAWWREGVEESTSPDAEDEEAALSPGSSGIVMPASRPSRTPRLTASAP